MEFINNKFKALTSHEVDAASIEEEVDQLLSLVLIPLLLDLF